LGGWRWLPKTALHEQGRLLVISRPSSASGASDASDASDASHASHASDTSDTSDSSSSTFLRSGMSLVGPKVER